MKSKVDTHDHKFSIDC